MIRSDVNALLLVLNMATSKASDDVLNTIDPYRQLRPVISYTVYEQFYFLLLHIALRLSFGLGGSDQRAKLQDAIPFEFLFSPIGHYLRKRYAPEQLASTFFEDLEEQFISRLNQSEDDYSFEQESFEKRTYRVAGGMKGQLAKRLKSALSHDGVKLPPKFEPLIEQAVDRRIASVLPIANLVDQIVEHDR